MDELQLSASELAAAGVSWNSLAVSFRPGFDFQQPLMSHVRDFLLVSNRDRAQVGQEAIISGDLISGNERAPLPAEYAQHQQHLEQLRTDGFFKIDTSWGLSELVGDSVRDEVSLRLGDDDFSQIRRVKVGRGDWLNSDDDIDGLDDLKRSLVPRIEAIAKSYLGDDTDFNGGYVALRLPARDMSWQEYLSGLWHHDSCGNRVKV
eukprot:2298890-Prymnesium_polylepis.1